MHLLVVSLMHIESMCMHVRVLGMGPAPALCEQKSTLFGRWLLQIWTFKDLTLLPQGEGGGGRPDLHYAKTSHRDFSQVICRDSDVAGNHISCFKISRRVVVLECDRGWARRSEHSACRCWISPGNHLFKVEISSIRYISNVMIAYPAEVWCNTNTFTEVHTVLGILMYVDQVCQAAPVRCVGGVQSYCLSK